MNDRAFMERALDLARRARGHTSPNPLVGAVVVTSAGEVVGEGFHVAAGAPHAEIVALQQAGARARGATIYSTLEPCSHHGRTGPCVEAIAAAGVARVQASMEDPNPAVRGRGFAWLRAHGIEVESGICERDARRLNEAFICYMQKGRPFVQARSAMSLDGRIAALAGRPTRLSGPEADAWVQDLRAECDAIAVGIGTILADDPRLTARGRGRTRPLTRVVFDSRLRTPSSARVVDTRDAGPVLVVTTEEALNREGRAAEALRARGVVVEAVPAVNGRLDLSAALRGLGTRELVHLVIEGGSGLIGSLLARRLVDKLSLIVTPHLLGSGALSLIGAADFGAAPIWFGDVSHEVRGNDVIWHGYPKFSGE